MSFPFQRCRRLGSADWRGACAVQTENRGEGGFGPPTAICSEVEMQPFTVLPTRGDNTSACTPNDFRFGRVDELG
jgi:hypothetical protein